MLIGQAKKKKPRKANKSSIARASRLHIALTPSQGVWASSVFYNSEIQVELSLDEISVTCRYSQISHGDNGCILKSADMILVVKLKEGSKVR